MSDTTAERGDLPTERQILFSGGMVRAILSGQKTQTRRVVKGEKMPSPGYCPYGGPGDELWVRETWRTLERWDHLPPTAIPAEFDREHIGDCRQPRPATLTLPVRFEADGHERHECRDYRPAWGKTRVSIHMPRWASRIQLRVTGVRVERVQDITAQDAMTEGVACSCMKPTPMCAGNIKAFHDLWDSINAPRGFGWDANPWVWVVMFEQPGAQNADT